MSVSKRTAIGKASLEVRLDVFNVFNRAHFANPGAAGLGVANTGATFGTAAFGSISAVRLPPREAQFGVRFLF